jgi:hypothetical protein
MLNDHFSRWCRPRRNSIDYLPLLCAATAAVQNNQYYHQLSRLNWEQKVQIIQNIVAKGLRNKEVSSSMHRDDDDLVEFCQFETNVMGCQLIRRRHYINCPHLCCNSEDAVGMQLSWSRGHFTMIQSTEYNVKQKVITIKELMIRRWNGQIAFTFLGDVIINSHSTYGHFKLNFKCFGLKRIFKQVLFLAKK